MVWIPPIKHAAIPADDQGFPQASVSRPMPVAMAATTWCTMALKSQKCSRLDVNKRVEDALKVTIHDGLKVNGKTWWFFISLELWKSWSYMYLLFMRLNVHLRFKCSSSGKNTIQTCKALSPALAVFLITSWQQQVRLGRQPAVFCLSTNQWDKLNKLISINLGKLQFH